MKKTICIIIILYSFLSAIGQKKTLDYSLYDKWPHIDNPKISNDGKFVLYSIRSQFNYSTLIVQAVDHFWKKEIPGANNGIITNDSKYCICTLPNDSLGILELGNNNLKKIPDVISYKMATSGDGKWLAYHFKKPKEGAVLHNMFTGEELEFPSILNYYFTNDGHVLLLQSNDNSVIWLNLSTGKADTIVKSNRRIENITFDFAGTQLAFISKEAKDGRIYNFIQYYKIGMDSASILADEKLTKQNANLNGDHYLFTNLRFSKDGSKLFFDISQLKDSILSTSLLANVDIWNYKDEYLQSQQQFYLNLNPKIERYFKALINIGENKIIRLTNESDNTWNLRFSNEESPDYALVNTRENEAESFWRISERSNVYLISLNTGSRKLILSHIWTEPYQPRFSSKGKYVIWYDLKKKQYFTYNIKTGIYKNITRYIHFPIYDDEDDHPFAAYSFGIAGWIEDDSKVLIYDRYDIWLVDPDGIKLPVNITRGYGRRHNVVLRYVDVDEIFFYASTIKKDAKCLLVSFNRQNKENGFFSLEIGKAKEPTKLTEGPFLYHLPFLTASSFSSFPAIPIKAKDSEVYIVKRMSATEYPNYFITKNFEKFISITNVNPQISYNWMTSELIHWMMFDGKKGEGILYKPENFNPTKKYPLIFYFYEKLSDELNNFINPDLSRGPLDISYYVSNGYLVFLPNIYYKSGYPGESAYNSVVSAAKYLSTMPWVDNKRLGIQGHSFGGYEVNYLITRTNIFAAAACAEGLSNLVSEYGSIRGTDGSSAQYLCEIDQDRLGNTLWSNSSIYINNSPIFKANKVNTPLLIMHNKEDRAVAWSQGLEYFTALRRLGKKVWMLQYDGERHSLIQWKNRLDYSIRLSQFFDHYLKGVPAPKWMTEGIQANKKGIETGYELDPRGSCGPNCLICRKISKVSPIKNN